MSRETHFYFFPLSFFLSSSVAIVGWLYSDEVAAMATTTRKKTKKPATEIFEVVSDVFLPTHLALY